MIWVRADTALVRLVFEAPAVPAGGEPTQVQACLSELTKDGLLRAQAWPASADAGHAEQEAPAHADSAGAGRQYRPWEGNVT